MPAKVKRLRIVAGPNGSGKSTIIERLRKNFDNSSETETFLRAAEIYRGKELTIHIDPVPEWINRYVINPLNFG